MVKIQDMKEKLESEFNKMFIHKAYIQYYFDPIHKESILKPIERIPLVLRIRTYQESFILRKPDHYLHGKPVFVVIRGYPLSIETTFLQTLQTSTINILHNVDITKTIIKVKKTLQYTKDSKLLLEMKNVPKPKIVNSKSNLLFKTPLNYYGNGKPSILTNILEKRNIEKNSSFELETWLQTSYNKILLKNRPLDLQYIIAFILAIISTIFATWLVADNYYESYYRAKYKGFLIIPITNVVSWLSYLIIYLMI